MQRLALRTLWITLVVAVAPAGATMLVRRLPLETIATKAARIVHARVVEVASGRDVSGVPATWVTLEVDRPVKGARAGRLTIKQIGTVDPLPDGAVAAVAGLPRYQPGEELVVFLRGESRRGFTSPVGMGQGVFRVRSVRGRRAVRSDLGDADQDLDEFLERVGRLAGDGE
jgi:hypothetical protein